jgi:hypothetical protein
MTIYVIKGMIHMTMLIGSGAIKQKGNLFERRKGPKKEQNMVYYKCRVIYCVCMIAAQR